MDNRTHKIEVELTKKFKGEYLDNEVFAAEVKNITNKYFMPAGYIAKPFIDPYSNRIIKVEVVYERRK